MLDDHSLVSIVIEKEDDLLQEIHELSKEPPAGGKAGRQKAQERLDRLKFSLQFYSKDYLHLDTENKNQANRLQPQADPDGLRESKPAKGFRIDTYKPKVPSFQAVYESLQSKPLFRDAQPRQATRTEPSAPAPKRALFKIRPLQEKTGSTRTTPHSSPFLATAKKFHMAPSPASVTKKKFFILPQPPKSRQLEF